MRSRKRHRVGCAGSEQRRDPSGACGESGPDTGGVEGPSLPTHVGEVCEASGADLPSSLAPDSEADEGGDLEGSLGDLRSRRHHSLVPWTGQDSLGPGEFLPIRRVPGGFDEGDRGAEGEAKAVENVVVMTMLYMILKYTRLGQSCREPGYLEIGRAIQEAANQDPLFPSREEGCRLTAALLLVLAVKRSDMRANLVMGKHMGLYQLLPPTPTLDGKLLLNPRTASLITIDLVRTRNLPIEPKELAAAVELCRATEERVSRYL